MQNNSEGVVSNIQRFAIQDGPGIRTTIFFKGCPLHCPWCSNPETMRLQPQIIVRDVKCIKCGRCVETCPQNAITIKDDIRIFDWGKCDSCLKCADTCPPRAIECVGEYMTVDKVLDIVGRDSGYYRHSNGGVTLSGGEPLVQWRFTLEVLRTAKQRGFHTALDTTGYAEWEVLNEVMEYTDLVLYDVKHMDSEIHKEATGVSNERILENLQRAVARPKARIWVRNPLIPDFNDHEKDLEELCRFVLSLGPGVEKVSLLPYHKYGEMKYAATGRIYTYTETALYSDERIQEFKQFVECHGIKVDIGK